MHRQSLCSPASKHGIVAGAGVIKDDNINNKLSPEDHRKEKLLADDEDEENQLNNNNQPKSMLISSSFSFRFIHLIPLLTLFCFIILYLASHDPSEKVGLITTHLAQFGGFTTLSSEKNVIDSSGFVIEKNDISANWRKYKELAATI
ncbi:hypothetical protein OSB04_022140, partial [Centaurea solstitialis]